MPGVPWQLTDENGVPATQYTPLTTVTIDTMHAHSGTRSARRRLRRHPGILASWHPDGCLRGSDATGRLVGGSMLGSPYFLLHVTGTSEGSQVHRPQSSCTKHGPCVTPFAHNYTRGSLISAHRPRDHGLASGV
jgi:hypothetical protein